MRVSVKAFARVLAGLALFFGATGCALFDFGGGSAVKFTAESNITTKAIYGDDVDEYQQIIWENGDPIRIVSNHAVTPGQLNYADYTVSRTGERNRYSYGKLNSPESGLMWDDSWTSAYEFWALYPASAGSSMTSGNFDGTFTASIPGADYLMVAHANAMYAQSKIVLEFYPAFTAFRFDINSDVEGVTINSLSLSSTTTPLTGPFTARIGDAGVTDVVADASSSMTAVSSLVEEKENGVRSFVIFCQPHTISNLTLQCNYTQDGTAKSKRLKLADAYGNMLTFAACKQHRMQLTLKASQGEDIHFNLTIGGAQMILSILADQIAQWNGVGMRMAMQRFGMNPDDQSQWWNGQHQDFWDFWNAFQNKPINYFNQFVSGVDKTNPPDCRVVFGEPYFSNDEMALIRDFLPTVTQYTHKTTLSESISASDFLYVPNLREINQEEIDEGTVRVHGDVSIEIDGMTQLERIDLHKWPNVTIRNCPSLTNLRITNTLNVTTNVLVDNCASLSSFQQDGSGYDFHFTFSNLPSLEVLYMNDAVSLTVDNCPRFMQFSFNLAKHLTNLTLKDTPVFSIGSSYNTESVVAVSLTNCGTDISNGEIRMQGNGNATNAGKVNSSHVTVRFVDNGGNVKAEF